VGGIGFTICSFSCGRGRRLRRVLSLPLLPSILSTSLLTFFHGRGEIAYGPGGIRFFTEFRMDLLWLIGPVTALTISFLCLQ
jgi:hypothetical protein